MPEASPLEITQYPHQQVRKAFKSPAPDIAETIVPIGGIMLRPTVFDQIQFYYPVASATATELRFGYVIAGDIATFIPLTEVFDPSDDEDTINTATLLTGDTFPADGGRLVVPAGAILAIEVDDDASEISYLISEWTGREIVG